MDCTTTRLEVIPGPYHPHLTSTPHQQREEKGYLDCTTTEKVLLSYHHLPGQAGGSQTIPLLPPRRGGRLPICTPTTYLDFYTPSPNPQIPTGGGGAHVMGPPKRV